MMHLPVDWTPSRVNALAGFAIGACLQELHAIGMPQDPESAKAIIIALRTTADIIEKYGVRVQPSHDLAAINADMLLHEEFHCRDQGLPPFPPVHMEGLSGEAES
jgi:hypothetical protein